MELTPRELERTVVLLSALDSRLRLQLVLLLADSDRAVNTLVTSLGKSQPLISQHLRILRAAGVVASRREGREVVYSLTHPGVVDAIHWLAGRGHSGGVGVAAIAAPGLTPSTPRPQKD